LCGIGILYIPNVLMTEMYNATRVAEARIHQVITER
jgi:hypothetical protein